MGTLTVVPTISWSVSGRNDHGTYCEHILNATTPLQLAAELRRGERLGWTFDAINAWAWATPADETVSRTWEVEFVEATTDEEATWAVKVPTDGGWVVLTPVGGWLQIIRELVEDICPGFSLDLDGELYRRSSAP